MRTFFRQTNLILVLGLFLTFFVSGRVVLADDEIDLKQALQEFFSTNFDVLINKFEIDKAYADYVTAKLRPNPTFSVNDIGLKTGKGFGASGDNAQMTFRIDQLLETGGKRKLRSSVASTTVEAAKLSYQDTIRSLLIGFYTNFFNMTLDLANIEAAKDDLTRFDRVLDIANKRFKAGDLSSVDIMKLEVSRIDLENTVTNAENQFKNDAEQFAMLIGREKAIKPVKIGEIKDVPIASEDVLLERAYQNRYDLLALQKQAKVAEKGKVLAKVMGRPDVSVGAERDTFGPDHSLGIGLGFSVALPLYNRNQGDRLRKKAELEQIVLQIEKTKRQIVLDIRQNLNNFQATSKVFDAYKKRKSDMEDLMARSEKAFTYGAMTVLDLLNTQKTFRDFKVKYNQAFVQCGLNRELIQVYTGEIK
ncbi:MAG: TolC family protein [Candidatus Riflebacteria bacterium]|nr:TolC family protein [Candidatus Riflebacteria bacterium]